MKLIFSNFKTLLKAMWKVEKKYYLYVLIYLVGMIAFSYYSIQLPNIVIGMLEVSQINYSQLMMVFLILLTASMLIPLAKVFYMPLGAKIRYHYLLEISKQYMSIPYDVYDDPKIKDSVWKISRPVSSIDGIQAFYVDLAQFIGNLGVLIVSVTILTSLKTWMVVIVLLWFVIFTILSIKAANTIDQRVNDNIEILQEEWYLDDISVDVAYGKEIRVFQLQSWLQEKLTTLIGKRQKLERLNETTKIIPLLLDDTYQLLRDGLIYLFLIIMFFNNEINIGELASYSVLIQQLNRALMAGSDSLQRLLSKQDNNKALFDFISLPTQTDEGLAIDPSQPWLIEFDNVSFKYPNTDHWIYKNLNFTIKENQKLAIVGLNGVGKTTLLKLLLRLYVPTSGVIKLNGININEYKLNDYFQLFAPVFQEINLFPFTAKENLVFDHDIDETTLDEAIKKSGLNDPRLQNQALDSIHLTRYLNPDGIVLSGGQAQKFATARAFAFNRPIYIFDEPTSALDAVAEYDFYHQVQENMRDKTILFVSHRLASTQFCDDILLIEGETIKEQGSHQQLLQQNGRYAELFKIQAKYYQEQVGDIL